MRPSLATLCEEIADQANELARVAAYRKCLELGGIPDAQLRLQKIIDEAGPVAAAELSKNFAELKRQLRRFYDFRPDRVIQHIELVRSLRRKGWLL